MPNRTIGQDSLIEPGKCLNDAGSKPRSHSSTPESPAPFALQLQGQGFPRRVVTKVFVGSGGIRAGWRLAIFLTIFGGLVTSLSLLARVLSHTNPSQPSILEPRTMLHNEVVAFLIVLFAAWVMSRIEDRRIADYGMPLRRIFGKQFWQGVVIGFAAITLLLTGMRLAGVFRFGTIGLRGFEPYEYGALWGLVFLFVGLFEEFFFRGYPLFTLTTGITFWPSAVVLSTLFGLIHHTNPGESWVGAVEAGATGLLFCLLLRRTGDLWMPIGFHAAWDWGETYFYGVRDSGLSAKGHLFSPTFTGPSWLTGGSVGPEGSWLSIALLAALWIIFAIWLGEEKYPKAGRLAY